MSDHILSTIQPYWVYLKPTLLAAAAWAACRLLYRLLTSNSLPKITSYQNKVVLITGASQGIGRALAEHFYVKGAKLILVARSLDKLAGLCAELPRKFPKLSTAPPTPEYAFLDLANPNGAAELAKLAGGAAQKIDVLVNNAGIAVHASCADTTMQMQRNGMEINYFGQIAVTQALLPHMAAGGSVVFVSSIQAKIALPHRAVYGASKHAITAYADALRAELAPTGLHVLNVCPGYVNTNLSANAIGEITEESRKNLANGMSPDYVAKKIAEAIAGRRQEYLLCPLTPRAAYWMRFLMPDLYFKVMAARALSEHQHDAKAK